MRDRLFHDVPRQAGRFCVHLDRGDAFARAGNLKVRAARAVFQVLQVGDDLIAPVLFIRRETHRDTGHRSGERYARVHEGERRSARRAHRGRAVRAENFRHDANRVRELLAVRKHGYKRAFGERAVADFAAPRTAVRLGFAHRVARKVVVMEKALGHLELHGVERLFHARRAERDA